MRLEDKHKTRICRLCLARQPPACFSLFENNFATMVEALTSTKLTPNDVFSVVCLKCSLNLKLAYNFQQKIRKSEAKFRESLHIKEESYTLEHEEVTINEEGDVKIDRNVFSDFVKLCEDKCAICGVRVGDNLMNDHIRKHYSGQQACDLCGTSFSNIHSYREHLFQHPERTVHQCNTCGAKFRYESLYNTHIESFCPISLSDLHTKDDEEIKIPRMLSEVCTEDSKQETLESQDLKTSTDNEINACPTCSKQFPNQKALSKHNNRHKTKTCPVCGRQVTRNNYYRHVENHSSGPQVCHLCGAVLQNTGSLINHNFYVHKDRSHKCDECGKSFKRKNVRDSHVKKWHLGKPTHCCETCGKGFYSGKGLKKHIRVTHLKLRPHICEFCNKGLSSTHALKTHRRLHTKETPFRCDICAEGFKHNVSLKTHKKSKHNIEEPNTCNCRVCGKGFASEMSLHAHMRVH